VNPLKWLGMAFLGLVTLLSLAVVHVHNPRAALVSMVLFSLAAAPTAAIVLIQGNPFEEPSAVSPAPIAAAVASVRPGPHRRRLRVPRSIDRCRLRFWGGRWRWGRRRCPCACTCRYTFG
jgi:hypothetical protein